MTILSLKDEGTFLLPEDRTFWSVQYTDDTWFREIEGASYERIERDRFKSFTLTYKSQDVFTCYPPTGATGRNFIYRRRIRLTESQGRDVVFIVGWMPHGPIYCVDIARGTYKESPGFVEGDPDLLPIQLYTDEERMIFGN